MHDRDPLADVPDPGTRFSHRVPWGIVFLLAAIPLIGLVLLLVL